jgi:hypothetical protein
MATESKHKASKANPVAKKLKPEKTKKILTKTSSNATSLPMTSRLTWRELWDISFGSGPATTAANMLRQGWKFRLTGMLRISGLKLYSRRAILFWKGCTSLDDAKVSCRSKTSTAEYSRYARDCHKTVAFVLKVQSNKQNSKDVEECWMKLDLPIPCENVLCLDQPEAPNGFRFIKEQSPDQIRTYAEVEIEFLGIGRARAYRYEGKVAKAKEIGT